MRSVLPERTRVCPYCAESIDADARRCRHCGEPLEGGARADEDLRGRDPDAGGEGPIAYCEWRADVAGILDEVRVTLADLVRGEGLSYRFVEIGRWSEDEPILQPDDIHVSGEVTQHELGSQLVRYILPLDPFDVGACKLEVQGRIRTGYGPSTQIRCAAQQSLGFLGGTGETLMQANRKAVVRQFTRRVAKHLTGRRILNADLRDFGRNALLLGLFSFTPLLGIVLGAGGLIYAGLALHLGPRRGWTKGRIPAWIGAVASLLGPGIGLWGFSQLQTP